MKNYFLAIFFFVSTTTFSQNKLEANWKTDGALMVGGTGLILLGEYFKDIPVLTPEQIEALNANDINNFDRSATRQYRGTSANSSDYFLIGATLTPFTLLLSKPARQDFLPIGFVIFETVIITNGITNISKGLTHRSRPYVYNPAVPLSEKSDVGARHSFFSGHASNTAAYSFLTAFLINRYADGKGLKIAGWAGAAALTATVSFLRYDAGKHYPTDVLTGSAVGAALGVLVPLLHRKKLPKDDTSWKSNLDFNIASNGFSLKYNIQ